MKAMIIRRLSVLAVLLTVLMAFTAFGFELKAQDGTTVRSTDKSKWGTVGTKENPIKYVDGTDSTFEFWATGVYFTKDCEFCNITAADNKTYRLSPVYNGEKQVTVSAGSGKFGTESSVLRKINFKDGTIESSKEVLDSNTDYDLSTVLTALNSAAAYEGYYPYFYKYYDSAENKRIFADASDPSITAADGTLGSCVYDVRDKDLELVWKDNSGSAAAWNDTQKAAGSFIAYRTGYTAEQYHTKFGGDAGLPYGTISLEKKLPGLDISAYSWVLTKSGSSASPAQTNATYTNSSMDKSFDDAVLVETITYGPSSAYTLVTDDYEFTVYGVPAVSDASIE